MALRQRRELFAAHGVECLVGDHESGCAQLGQLGKDAIEVAFGGGIQDMKLKLQRAGRFQQVSEPARHSIRT